MVGERRSDRMDLIWRRAKTTAVVDAPPKSARTLSRANIYAI
jgi:hypothetical protein